MGSRTWFDSRKVLEGERLVRSAPVRVRTEAPPYWWEGELILTSERLFFLPSVENPLLGDVACWLGDVVECRTIGRNRFRMAAQGLDRTFQLLSLRPAAVLGFTAASWVRDVERLRGALGSRSPLQGHRAAG